MSFVWPKLLGLLILVPAIVVLYVSLLRRRARRAADLAAQGFVLTAASERLRRRRHVPYAFFLAALTLLLVALARPQTNLTIPRREGTVVLAFDVSNSMRATDLAPTRIDAAKTAANAFVAKQPDTIKVGVVAFSDGALITQPPTRDKTAVLKAIGRLKAQGGTSIGAGIFTSLSAIAGKPIAIDPAKLAAATDATELDIPYLGSAAIVLLSDGENTANPAPLDVAKLASSAGVTIFPIGIGSTAGTVVEIDGFKVATALDEDGLGEIAKVTNGTYFHAEDGASLTKVYKSINLKWKSETKKNEVTALVTGASVALLVIGAAFSLLLLGRMV